MELAVNQSSVAQIHQPASPTNRLVSLDVFRGLTVAAMLLVNNPGSDYVYPQLDHAAWNGWTFTDTIFPFFLWIVGVAITLSFAKRVESGADRRQLFLHVLRRSATIYLIGVLMAGFPFYHLEHIRLVGVLPRIAVCYLVASSLFLFTELWGQISAAAVLLFVYWLAMMFYPVPGLGAGHLDRGSNFASYIDGQLLTGHMWAQTKTWDPEGIVSTFPAIATTLFGVMAGHILRTRSGRTVRLALLSVTLIALGELLSIWMPVNKSLWTDPYALLMAGLAGIEFLVLYWLVDVRSLRSWAVPFIIFGSNAIIVFVLSGLIGRLFGVIHAKTQTLAEYIYTTMFAPLASPVNASLLYAIAFVGMLFLVAWALYRRRWFLRV